MCARFVCVESLRFVCSHLLAGTRCDYRVVSDVMCLTLGSLLLLFCSTCPLLLLRFCNRKFCEVLVWCRLC